MNALSKFQCSMLLARRSLDEREPAIVDAGIANGDPLSQELERGEPDRIEIPEPEEWRPERSTDAADGLGGLAVGSGVGDETGRGGQLSEAGRGALLNCSS